MGGFGQWWQQHFLGAEAVSAIIVSTGITISLWLPTTEPMIEAQLADSRTDVYRTIATMSGALLGFSMTISTLVLGYWDSQRIRLIREHPQRRHELWTTLIQSTWFLALLALSSIVAMILDKDTAPSKYAMIPFLYFFSLAIARLARAIWIIQGIVKIVSAGPTEGISSH